jgi:hypothetical protein
VAGADQPRCGAKPREGLDETLTVVRLGVSEALRRTLATTNPIESELSVTRRVKARVTRWRDSDRRRRWCAAGLLRAESKFRRLEGNRRMPTLLKALEGIVEKQAAGNDRGAARKWSGEPPLISTTDGSALCKAEDHLPVKVLSGQSLAGRPGPSLAGVAATRGPKRRQGSCGER